jgi:small subunit ribosomal protein S6
MRDYELTVLVHPDLEADLDKPLDAVRGIVTSADGTVVSTDNWGKKRLAYKIEREDFAVYSHMIVQLPPQSVARVDAALNIEGGILRHLLVGVDPKQKVAEAEAAAKAEKAAKPVAAEVADTPENEA